MADEVVGAFASVPSGVLVDVTLGGGNHSALLLDSRADCRLVGIDRDPAALEAAEVRLASYGDRVTLRHARFDDLATVMTDLGLPRVSGVLFDLGVSSPQLDLVERGFSYRGAGPVDMRMDPTQPWSAADVVNGYSVDDLTRVLRDYGDERFAYRIAQAIVAARPIEDTLTLAEIVRSAIPAPARRRGGHPAKRTFQAIRIEVNRELEILPTALDSAIELLAPGGRVAVLSYHSGEDRLVKAAFRRTVRIVRPEHREPSPAERESNPRAESARLRIVEKL
jgi:16S rRNA (cytosine1402-N4)-methyltransferase